MTRLSILTGQIAMQRHYYAYDEFVRTLHISTTHIVGRMLHRNDLKKIISKDVDLYHDHLISEFTNPAKPKKGCIVYIDGSFDLYHAGHCSIIKAAKESGDFLIIGLHSDEEMAKNNLHPIMSYKERKLCLLSNKYIDEILDNAPYYPSIEYLRENSVDKIYCGKKSQHLYKNINEEFQVIVYEGDYSDLNANVIIGRVIKNAKDLEMKLIQ